MRISDWSADVCSSDLFIVAGFDAPFRRVINLRDFELAARAFDQLEILLLIESGAAAVAILLRLDLSLGRQQRMHAWCQLFVHTTEITAAGGEFAVLVLRRQSAEDKDGVLAGFLLPASREAECMSRQKR